MLSSDSSCLIFQDDDVSFIEDLEKQQQAIANTFKKAGVTGTFKLIEEKAGVTGIYKRIEKRVNAWQKIKLNIGVTGETGVGKSKFINAIRGLKPGDKGLAKTGYTETTEKAKGYPHPDNQNLVIYDLPGIGSPEFRRSNYCSDKRIGFDYYDTFVIIISTRVRDHDIWLAKEIKERNKSFVFVRSKVEEDIRNAKTDNNISDKEKETDVIEFEKRVIKEMRDDCTTKLRRYKVLDGDDSDVFLIDSVKTEHPRLDFDKLVNRIHNSFEGLKRDAFTLSISKNASYLIEEKRNLLIDRSYVVAIKSAVGSVIPIPGVSSVVDIALLESEFLFYQKQFFLDESAIKYIASATNQTPAQLGRIAQLTINLTRGVGNILVVEAIRSIVAPETIEIVAKYALPIIGSIVGNSVSYVSTVYILRRLINSLADDAIKVNKYCELLLERKTLV